MKTSSTLIMAFGLAAALASCGSDKNESPVGSWVAGAPETVTASVDGATSATKVISFDFTEDGTVTYTADYDVTAPSYAEDGSESTPVSYKVTASVKGTYKLEPKEDDDYIVAFDMNSLSVQGTDAPELGPVTGEFMTSTAQFTSIEDVKVSKDGTAMTFEAGHHPEVKYSFVKK